MHRGPDCQTTPARGHTATGAGVGQRTFPNPAGKRAVARCIESHRTPFHSHRNRRESRTFGLHKEYRHHRSRGPRQDHAGGPDAAPDRVIPGRAARRRARDGLQSAGAGAGHHDLLQERLRALGRSRRRRREDQHRRYARTRRFRRRGRADPPHGGRRAPPGGRVRRSHAADALRHAKSAGAGTAPGDHHQQGGPSGRRSRCGCTTKCSSC